MHLSAAMFYEKLYSHFEVCSFKHKANLFSLDRCEHEPLYFLLFEEQYCSSWFCYSLVKKMRTVDSTITIFCTLNNGAFRFQREQTASVWWKVMGSVNWSNRLYKLRTIALLRFYETFLTECNSFSELVYLQNQLVYLIYVVFFFPPALS